MRSLSMASSLLVIAGCCFDGLAGLSPPPIAPPIAPALATGGPHMPGGPGHPLFGTVTIGEGGLAPDPTNLNGMAGGPTLLSGMAGGCVGHVSPMASHHITVEGLAGVRLRVMAYAPTGQDLTIGVRRPDGGMICNDDSDGLNPMVEDTFGPGEYDVWVGTYGAGLSGVPYEFGVTTNLLVTPSVLRTPPVAGVSVAPGTPPPPG